MIKIITFESQFGGVTMFGKKRSEGVKYGEGKPFIHGKLLVNIFEAKDLPDMDNGKHIDLSIL